MKITHYLVLLVVFFCCYNPLHTQVDSLSYFYKQSVEAYDSGDVATFLLYTEKAIVMRPNNQTLLYNAACGYSLADQVPKAAHFLKRFTRLNSTVDYSQDPDLKTLVNAKEYEAVKRLQIACESEIIVADSIFKLNSNEHIESITYDPTDQSFYVGSVNKRAIYEVNQRSGEKRLLVDYFKIPGLYAVMGLAVDSATKLLWICSASLPQMIGFDSIGPDRSSLLAYDLDKKQVIFAYQPKSPAIFGDLILASNGSVYVSDGKLNRIYHIQQDEVDIVVDRSGQRFNFQGLALNPEETTLFIADYFEGITALDLESGKLSKFTMPINMAHRGIDGINYFAGHLICHQNGTKPMRIISVPIDENRQLGNAIVLEQGTFLNEPTQGVVYKGTLYSISNSQWSYYQDNRYLNEDAPPTEIRRIPLQH